MHSHLYLILKRKYIVKMNSNKWVLAIADGVVENS